jgi:hypothetical protein
MKINPAFIVTLGLFALAANSATITKIVDSGPDDNRVVFAIAAEGYTSDEQNTFNLRVQELADSFFNLEPWKSYKDL